MGQGVELSTKCRTFLGTDRYPAADATETNEVFPPVAQNIAWVSSSLRPHPLRALENRARLSLALPLHRDRQCPLGGHRTTSKLLAPYPPHLRLDCGVSPPPLRLVMYRNASRKTSVDGEWTPLPSKVLPGPEALGRGKGETKRRERELRKGGVDTAPDSPPKVD